MNKLMLAAVAAVALTAACCRKQERIDERAAELCLYIPDHGLPEGAEHNMTADFYAALDTMFNHLPEHEAMDHEWLHYFVTSNGGTMADCEVASVEQTDHTHAVAVIRVRQKWDDGTFDENTDVEHHRMDMEKVEGRWLMADFDGHKQDCLRHIDIARREEAVRRAIGDYLASHVAPQYRRGQFCVPAMVILAAEEPDSGVAQLWCDCWVGWYDAAGDTLKSVSGGNHAGRFTLTQQGGKPVVTAFEQTTDGAAGEASAKRIFGRHYDVYHNSHSNPDVIQAVRIEQLSQYVRRNRLGFRYCQDYGWPARDLRIEN